MQRETRIGISRNRMMVDMQMLGTIIQLPLCRSRYHAGGRLWKRGYAHGAADVLSDKMPYLWYHKS